MRTARLQGLIGKAGKDPEQRRLIREFGMQTSPTIQGPADQVVVAMTSPITSGRSKGSVDMVVSGVMNEIVYCQLAGYQNLCFSGLSHWNHIFQNHCSRDDLHIKPQKGRMCMIMRHHV